MPSTTRLRGGNSKSLTWLDHLTISRGRIVRKSLRGRGVASELFSAVENYARDIRVTKLELTVSAENSVAIGFSLREGFIETS
ncbi:GNAT family N-acetyltransferase [Brucella pituitosa]|uniref:GNAT family N-acetyltransferase n=1 Tax=Brucella pituitosa TaxID=571256 RepID=UPI003F4AD620